MNKQSTLFLAILMVCSLPLFSTEQQKDIIIYHNEECLLYTHFAFLSPLEIYYRTYSQPAPFFMLSTGNYRGFVATWKMDQGKLFLTGIAVGQEPVDLPRVFFDKCRDGKVHAEWFSGVILIMASPRQVWFDSRWNPGKKEYYIDYEHYVFAEVNNGSVVQEVTLSSEQYWKQSNDEQENRKHFSGRELAMFRKFDEYTRTYRTDVPAALKRPVSPQEQESFNQAWEYVISVHKERQRKIDEEKEKKRRKAAEIARSFYPLFPGYDKALKVFTLREDPTSWNPAMDGVGIEAKLVPIKPDIINGVWWTAYTKEVKENRYSWDDLVELYQKASTLLSRHKWLRKWRDAGKNRTVLLRVVGKKPFYTAPSQIEWVWTHAGLKGLPGFQIALWVDDEFRGHLFLGENDSYVLILQIRPKDHQLKDPDQYDEQVIRQAVKKEGGHWLDYCSFGYDKDQTIPQYIVVTPDGSWKTNNHTKNR